MDRRTAGPRLHDKGEGGVSMRDWLAAERIVGVLALVARNGSRR
jgi:hypothetical protein